MDGSDLGHMILQPVINFKRIIQESEGIVSKRFNPVTPGPFTSYTWYGHKEGGPLKSVRKYISRTIKCFLGKSANSAYF